MYIKDIANQRPFFSIITPTFNCGPFLDRSYKCLCMQDVEDWEWIVVDDGSTDGTKQMLERISDVDSRVKVLTLPENRGRGYARNAALRLCRGVGIVIWDVDDIYLPSRLRHIRIALEDGYDFFCSYALIVDTKLHIKGARHFFKAPEDLFPSFVHPTLAFRSSLLSHVEYNENMRAGEDLLLMINLENNFRGFYSEEYLMLYVEDREINIYKTIEMQKNHMKSIRELISRGSVNLSVRQKFKILFKLKLKTIVLQVLRISPRLYLRSVSMRRINYIISGHLNDAHISVFKEFKVK